ncbi:MAG: putative ABC transporter permease [Ruminococcus sp.]|nr:putative ABC transporter permease [Ruminococcus sp.]
MNSGTEKTERRVTYPRLFWLVIIGSVLGVIIEGVWYYFMHDRWETHVVTIWGPFCLIYGLGGAVYYAGNCLMEGKNIVLRYAVFLLIGTGVELLCGLLLKYGLNMRAWTYKGYPFNFMDLICLKMAIIWGFVGLAFGLLVKPVDKLFSLMQGRYWNWICAVFSAFMAVNLVCTCACMIRWKQRHDGKPASGKVAQIIDEHYDDDFMQTRFVEWRFLS